MRPGASLAIRIVAFVFLFVSPFVMMLGGLLPSWVLAGTALAMLAAVPAERQPALVALAVLLSLLVLGVVSIGVIVGAFGEPLARAPVLDPTDTLFGVALLAPALAIFSLLFAAARPRIPRLALLGAVIVLLGFVGGVINVFRGLNSGGGLEFAFFLGTPIALFGLARHLFWPDGVASSRSRG